MGQLVEEGRHVGPAIVADGLVFDVVLDWDSAVNYEQRKGQGEGGLCITFVGIRHCERWFVGLAGVKVGLFNSID